MQASHSAHSRHTPVQCSTAQHGPTCLRVLAEERQWIPEPDGIHIGYHHVESPPQKALQRKHLVPCHPPPALSAPVKPLLGLQRCSTRMGAAGGDRSVGALRQEEKEREKSQAVEPLLGRQRCSGKRRRVMWVQRGQELLGTREGERQKQKWKWQQHLQRRRW